MKKEPNAPLFCYLTTDSCESALALASRLKDAGFELYEFPTGENIVQCVTGTIDSVVPSGEWGVTAIDRSRMPLAEFRERAYACQ